MRKRLIIPFGRSTFFLIWTSEPVIVSDQPIAAGIYNFFNSNELSELRIRWRMYQLSRLFTRVIMTVTIRRGGGSNDLDVSEKGMVRGWIIEQ
ncbi:hypothetical protein J2T15_000147 [Paenibacillus harenae]|uniref:Uncharacterized protein n=1 Tax=Paenibacillus harenae TaxID=306543 RepID=A0ABT9TTR5_PAEHA|nr:hypothetical protein [Paenibacillus harenae]